MQLTPEEAYLKLVTVHGFVKDVCDSMEALEKYSPFSYLAGKMKTELRDIRGKLIRSTVEALKEKHMPNAEPQKDFTKLMTEKAGELEFRSKVLEAWFLQETADKDQLREKSLQHLVKEARYFLPYIRDETTYHGPCKDPEQLTKDNMLELRAYTWRTASSYVPGSISYSLNSKGEAGALESLIDIVTQGRDPTTARADWLTNHIRNTRQDPPKFYGKHQVNHKTVKALQFFKNNKFKIWFKTSKQAEAVAKTLVTGELHQDQPSPSPLFS